MKKSGFTLIEILVVMAIISVLAVSGVTSYTASLRHGRDAKRKAEVEQMKNALRLYYNDYVKYPGSNAGGTAILGCGALGVTACPCAGDAAFASGNSCSIVYMKQLPSEFGTKMLYYQLSSGDDFLLKVPLEDTSDPSMAVTRTRCPGSGGFTCNVGDYCACAD